MDYPLHPITDDYADFTDQEFAALRESLKANGQIVEVVIWNGQIVDGRHRAKLCRELGLDIKHHDIGDVPEDKMRAVVRTLNEHRRSRTTALTTAEKRARIEAGLKANPKLSNRQIADMLGVSHPTVAEVRKQLASTGKITSSEKTVGKDGKSRSQPALKPTASPKRSALDEVRDLHEGAKIYVASRHGRVGDDDARVIDHVVKACNQQQLDAIMVAPSSSPFGKVAWRNAAATKAMKQQEPSPTPEQSAEKRKTLYDDETPSAPPVTPAGRVKSPTEYWRSRAGFVPAAAHRQTSWTSAIGLSPTRCQW
jgi:DNA-binding Lrp family transcriptional regulator